MGGKTVNRTSAPSNNRDQLIAGILIGTIIGVGLAAGVAWYMMKSPKPFLQRAPSAEKLPAVTSTTIAPPGTASTDGSAKPRFEFYKVLTDKQDKTAEIPPRPAETNRASDRYEPHLLQAGSFQNVEDAEKLKAKLALLGVEANVLGVNIPEKGVWYRVRLGPYKTANEENVARNFLKQNGVDSTPIRVQ